jgi:hypothetical protein
MVFGLKYSGVVALLILIDKRILWTGSEVIYFSIFDLGCIKVLCLLFVFILEISEWKQAYAS